MSKIFAHRGYSGKYPENTMIAFIKAVEVGVDGIELDVQLTKDGEVVIIHDETLDRTTNGKGYVNEYSLEEISKFNAKFIFDELDFTPIPTLREYLEYIKEFDIVTNIELKNSIIDYSNIEKKVVELVKEFNLEEKVIISSFNHFSILRVKSILPTLKCAFLSEDWIIDAGKYTSSHNIECYHPRFTSLTPPILEELKKYNLEINTWTVNEKKDIKQLLEKKVDSIITNYPELAIQIRDNKEV